MTIKPTIEHPWPRLKGSVHLYINRFHQITTLYSPASYTKPFGRRQAQPQHRSSYLPRSIPPVFYPVLFHPSIQNHTKICTFLIDILASWYLMVSTCCAQIQYHTRTIAAPTHPSYGHSAMLEIGGYCFFNISFASSCQM